MSSSLNEDRDSRKTTSMEESSSMTIEFLRARLLSERSVSKSARQRADELAKRVAELEEKLQLVSLQRKKAEKATADVLAILENRGISDVSEEFDSNSDEEESSHNSKSSKGLMMIKETSTNVKPNHEGEVYSSSEIESSPSTGRSLAWKSTKDSQHSLEKKKYMESVRRRASFASSSCSARRVGKSCRRIRRRETRSMEELQNDSAEKVSCSIDASNCSDGEHAALREGSGYDNGTDQLDSAAEGSHSESQKINGHYYNGHERDEDMESALQHQAQLIGRYEEEEKAQREWEEKFRENNNCTQEAYDPGNHSDVTEERYEMEAPKVSCDAAMLNSDNQEKKHEPGNACSSEEPQTSKNLLTLIDGVESSASEFSFPTTKIKSDPKFLGKQHDPSELRHQQYLPISSTTHPSAGISSHFEKKVEPSASPSISSSPNLAVVPRDTSNNLVSVLEALQQAKLSLNQKIQNIPLSGSPSSNAIIPSNPNSLVADSFKLPVFSPGLFRLPTDAWFEATSLANPGVGAQSSLANFLPDVAPSRFPTEPLVESRSSFSSSLFHTAPNRSFTPEIRSGAPPQRSFSQPRLSDPYTSPAHPVVADTYPYLPDITFRLPLNEEGTSRSFPSSETGMPPVTHLSSYFDRFRPNMHYR